MTRTATGPTRSPYLRSLLPTSKPAKVTKVLCNAPGPRRDGATTTCICTLVLAHAAPACTCPCGTHWIAPGRCGIR